MARDRTKNAYYTVGIPIDSETHRALTADSQETGVSVAQLLAVRVTDWYKRAVSGAYASPSHPAEVPTTSVAEKHPNAASGGAELQSRAVAAAAVWGGEDDEE